ncbi:protein translocase subunit SecD [Erythrobacter sp. WG]|uniref:protein translocase subunit SecD n=1 Tax=Erythrobacter sp. WG TaxID=2985510 RepID=UPI00226ED284|nr:protein translocase subunit SecD [Erythrobacter sp. WG]MCX9147499.1 protein translocase subunit SecD [Erythrobacter sp. WG]
MLDFPLWKKLSLWAVTLAAALLALPSLASVAGLSWPAQLPDPRVNLGLDLAGGSHLLLEAKAEDVRAQRLTNMEETVRQLMRGASPRIRIGDVSTANGQLSFMLENAADIDRARGLIEPAMQGATTVREWELSVVDGQRMVLSQTEAGVNQAIDDAMDSATEVVRRRIDELGTREPTIIRQGATRIVVQVPGLQDPAGLKALLGQTAQLEFKLVDLNALPSNVEAGIAPPGSEIFPFAPGTPEQGASLAVKRLGGIRGENLTNAQAGVDQQTNRNVVNITFDGQGGAKFAKLTSENVGKPFAIILDGKVLSAPSINEPIVGGRAQISGSFTPESANTLAISLRSGALPVPLAVVEERTVGPDLGADSIRKGLIAMGIGSLAVIALMIGTYGRFGIYATVALVFNVLMLLGLMALGGFTLTLPGIAGFVITIGAAVDANVLINERIREERARGRKVVAAVETGYREASRAIWDANLTNVISGVALFAFGSGPVKGFAVVLVIGIVTSVFTGVTLTRMFVAGWLRKARPNDIVI